MRLTLQIEWPPSTVIFASTAIEPCRIKFAECRIPFSNQLPLTIDFVRSDRVLSRHTNPVKVARPRKIK